MGYIYDILLNFNKNLIEYFEWEELDNIKYIKKIILFKVNTYVIKDLIDYEVLLEDNFIKSIPKYDINGFNSECKICLLTDENITIGILITNGKVTLISRLLLDEELETLELANSLPVTSISYQKLTKKNKNNDYLTRKEQNIKKYLKKSINKLYKEKNIAKLKYLYYEYTNKESKDIDYIFNYLINSLRTFNNKHILIYNILSMIGTAGNKK